MGHFSGPTTEARATPSRRRTKTRRAEATCRFFRRVRTLPPRSDRLRRRAPLRGVHDVDGERVGVGRRADDEARAAKGVVARAAQRADAVLKEG